MFFAIAYFLFCAACFVLAFARHPIYGLYLYLATIYVFPPSRWWGYMVPDLRWALLSAATTAIAILFHRGKLGVKPVWFSNPPAVILILYTTWMWIQTPWALDVDGHLDGSIKFVKYLAAFWFVYRLSDTKETLRDILFAHGLGCGLLGIYARVTPREAGRLDGVGGPGIDDANTLAMYFATGALVCLGLLLMEKGWRRWACLGVLALILNGFVLANSRGAFLGLIAGGAVLGLCKARVHRRLFWSFALAGVLGFAVVVDQIFIERMFTIGDVVETDENADMSARSRMEIYKAQMQMVIDYPFGAGYRGTAELSTKYLDRKWLTGSGAAEDAQRASHNTFMTTLVEQGIPGAILFACLIIWIILCAFRIRRLDKQGVDPALTTMGAAICGALTAVVVAGSAADYLMAEVQFWLFAALVSVLQLSQASKLGHQGAGAVPAPRVINRLHA
jgi:O-Antigen ligase